MKFWPAGQALLSIKHTNSEEGEKQSKNYDWCRVGCDGGFSTDLRLPQLWNSDQIFLISQTNNLMKYREVIDLLFSERSKRNLLSAKRWKTQHIVRWVP